MLRRDVSIHTVTLLKRFLILIHATHHHDEQTTNARMDFRPWLFLPLVVASGCAALIYEIIWFQLLQLVIGSSAISLGLLLAAYMGGLCLGSAALGRRIFPTRHPLIVYAWLEVGIGIFGIAILFGLPLIG